MRVLVTRPRHDEGNLYLYWWTKQIIQLAVKKGIEVLEPKEANERSKKLYKKEIRRAFTSEGDTSILPALIHNMKHQVCIEK